MNNSETSNASFRHCQRNVLTVTLGLQTHVRYLKKKYLFGAVTVSYLRSARLF